MCLGAAVGGRATPAACGEQDDAGGDVLSKQEWIAAADAICVELNDRLAEIPEPETLEILAATGDEVNQLARDAIGELRALEPSPEEQDDVAELLDAFDALVDAGDEFVGAAADGEPPAELLRTMDAAADTAERLAADYGLEVCLLSPQ